MNQNIQNEVTGSLPPLLTVSPSPHIKGHDSTRTIMLDVVIALLPPLIFACYIFGMRALTVTLVSVASCLLAEGLFNLLLKRHQSIGDLSAAVTGMLLAYNLPVSVPLWIPIFGAFFAIVVVKGLFGGIGKNVVNPALAARVFLFMSFPDLMSRYVPAGSAIGAFDAVGDADILAGATPLAQLKQGMMPDLPLMDLIIGNCPGAIGEVSSLLLIAGFIYLMVRKVITWHIPIAYVGSVALICYLLPSSPAFIPHEFMLSQIFSGGLLLGAIFMATDYVTSPITRTGRIIFGVGCGIITVFIRYFGGYSEGVSFAILIMNLLVRYIDGFTKPVKFGGMKKQA